jgi:hypothetical protein
MAQLTHAQKKSFAADMPGILRKNKDEFAGKDFDPLARATAIDGLNAPIADLTGDRTQKEQVYHAAVTAENAAIDKAYEEASRAVKGIDGVLPASHPLVRELHKKRELMDNEAARGKQTTKPA